MRFETRQPTIETIETLRIPKSMLASACDERPARISDYVQDRPLSTDQANKIERAVQKIAVVYQTFAPYRIILDSPEILEYAVADAGRTVQLRALAQSHQRTVGEFIQAAEEVSAS
jgi:hypothetical protein